AHTGGADDYEPQKTEEFGGNAQRAHGLRGTPVPGKGLRFDVPEGPCRCRGCLTLGDVLVFSLEERSALQRDQAHPSSFRGRDGYGPVEGRRYAAIPARGLRALLRPDAAQRL